MNESEAKRTIVANVQARGGYARRIEDKFSVGFPDLVLVLPDYPVFFCEAKIIVGHTFGPTPRQYVELKRLAISKHSCPMLAGLGPDGRWYLHPHAESAHVTQCWKQQDDDFFDTLCQWYDKTQRKD